MEAVKGQRTVTASASDHKVHANQITTWKKQLLAVLPEVFDRQREEDAAHQQELIDRLYQQNGQFKVELDWVKGVGP